MASVTAIKEQWANQINRCRQVYGMVHPDTLDYMCERMICELKSGCDIPAQESKIRSAVSEVFGLIRYERVLREQRERCGRYAAKRLAAKGGALSGVLGDIIAAHAAEEA